MTERLTTRVWPRGLLFPFLGAGPGPEQPNTDICPVQLIAATGDARHAIWKAGPQGEHLLSRQKGLQANGRSGSLGFVELMTVALSCSLSGFRKQFYQRPRFMLRLSRPYSFETEVL
jgi:hypothetical protein